MADRIMQRLAALPVLPEARAALAWLVEHDWHGEEFGQEREGSQATLEAVYRALGGDPKDLEPFLLAWLTLRATLSRLDHLQDNEITNPAPLSAVASIGEHYNLVFAYYVLATALLDGLDDTALPPRRLRELTRLWNDTMLWAASGQQRDLARIGPQDQVDAALEHFQEAIQAKAGAVYALAFGGTAVLATDDTQTIAALSLIGQIYGILLQFSDDFLDANAQTDPALTLAQVYTRVRTISGLALPPHQLQHYWDHIYSCYIEQVEQVLAILSPQVQAPVRALFRSTFDSWPHEG